MNGVHNIVCTVVARLSQRQHSTRHCEPPLVTREGDDASSLLCNSSVGCHGAPTRGGLLRCTYVAEHGTEVQQQGVHLFGGEHSALQFLQAVHLLLIQQQQQQQERRSAKF